MATRTRFSLIGDIRMTEGKLLGNMIRYAIPIILTNLLQLFYNSADMYVLANFCSDPNAMGSVGCTGSMIQLVIGLFLGLGAGISVVLAQNLGAGRDEEASRVVHTSLLTAVILGVLLAVAGYFVTPPLLTLMKTGDEFMAGATLYVRIYLAGSVGNLLFNFSAGMLRSKGDTVHPLIFSSIGGLVNIFLNLFFVLVFDMGVEGVAIATILSQTISAVLTLIHMARLTDACRFIPKKLRISPATLRQLIRYGLPAGLQGTMFSISNVLLQTSYNELGAVFVNANTAGQNVDSYIYQVLNSFYFVALSFASQNYGAGKYRRLKDIYLRSCACVLVSGIVMGVGAYLFSDQLVGLFTSVPEELAAAKRRLIFVALPYFLCGLMDIGTAMLRAIGGSTRAMVITLVGSCLLRVVWVYTVFEAHRSIDLLYVVYPISWLVTFLALLTAYLIMYRLHIKPLELRCTQSETIPQG